MDESVIVVNAIVLLLAIIAWVQSARSKRENRQLRITINEVWEHCEGRSEVSATLIKDIIGTGRQVIQQDNRRGRSVYDIAKDHDL